MRGARSPLHPAFQCCSALLVSLSIPQSIMHRKVAHGLANIDANVEPSMLSLLSADLSPDLVTLRVCLGVI